KTFARKESFLSKPETTSTQIRRSTDAFQAGPNPRFSLNASRRMQRRKKNGGRCFHLQPSSSGTNRQRGCNRLEAGKRLFREAAAAAEEDGPAFDNVCSSWPL